MREINEGRTASLVRTPSASAMVTVLRNFGLDPNNFDSESYVDKFPRVAISDRKAREWRSREELILERADEMLRAAGYLGLNLDQLAERIEYSKATIYNHFPSKEDLIVSVCTKHLALRASLFERALTFEGKTRERICLVGLADRVIAERYPHAFPLLQLAQTPSIWEKTQPEAREAFTRNMASAMATAIEVVRQGRREGDLPADAPDESHVFFGLVTMSTGAHLLQAGPCKPQQMLGAEVDALDALERNYHAFLDGIGWRPLSTEWDYEKTRRRIMEEAFGNGARAAVRRRKPSFT